MNRSEFDLLPAAAALARRAGRPEPISLAPLAGGQNNRVFEAKLEGGDALILKSYFCDPRDPRDRLGAEWKFLTFAWARGVRNVPEPLACDLDRRLGLYTRLPGAKLPPGGVEAIHVEAALDFVLALNAPRTDITALPAASEACFSTVAHIATVERRVRGLASLDGAAPLRKEAERLVTERLAPVWRRVRHRVEEATAGLGASPVTPLKREEEIVSPSDFGFHNALFNRSEFGFLDFEYAGRDDPAKLVCDFFCQPEVPVPASYFTRSVDRLIGGLGLPDSHRERCAVLLDLYRIKWTCIILNHFLPIGAARRAFADPRAREAACAEQLAKADAKLGEVETS